MSSNALKRSYEEYDNDNYDNKNITVQEVEKLHKVYKGSINNLDSQSDSEGDSQSEDGVDSESSDKKIFFKNRHKSKKETTMLYMFKKYEILQKECNQYKNKLYKMKLRMNLEEQKQHYKNLEFSNVLLDKERLQHDLKRQKNIIFKYSISIAFLTAGIVTLAYSSNSLHNFIQYLHISTYNNI